MSNRSLTNETRTIHPRALSALGEKACIVMLGVAADLRSGVIPAERYDQKNYGYMECGTPCCIAGHLARRLGEDLLDIIWSDRVVADHALPNSHGGLFAGEHRSDPQLAARAIERYIYEGADNPWGYN